VFDRPTARRYDRERRHAEHNAAARQLPAHELETQRREEALSTSTLTAENKGFGLMLKMGYKTGETLGKATTTLTTGSRVAAASIEPIRVVLKSDRLGLGQAEERKRKVEEIEQLRKRFKSKSNGEDERRALESDYLKRKKLSFQLRKLRHNLHKCQRVCFQLDSERKVFCNFILNKNLIKYKFKFFYILCFLKLIKRPDVAWYWPRVVLRAIKSGKSVKKESAEVKKRSDQEDEVDEVDESAARDRYGFCEAVGVDRAGLDLKRVYNDRLDNFLANGSGDTERENACASSSSESRKRETVEPSNDDGDDDDDDDYERSVLSQKERDDKILAEMRKGEDDGISDKEEGGADEFDENEETEEEDDEEVNI
jgi:hypothetical protein